MVLHYTAMHDAAAALDRLCDSGAEVSAHYLIGADGMVWHMVQETDRAWHAGAGSWRGQGDINSRSIGIELDNRGTHPFSEPQMTALERLLPGILSRWAIPPSGVIAHSDMAPGRKSDPGPRFDWRRLGRAGLAPALDPLPPVAERVEPGDPNALRDLLDAIGYAPDEPLDTTLQAFRDRACAGLTGPVSRADLSAARALLQSLQLTRPADVPN